MAAHLPTGVTAARSQKLGWRREPVRGQASRETLPKEDTAWLIVPVTGQLPLFTEYLEAFRDGVKMWAPCLLSELHLAEVGNENGSVPGGDTSLGGLQARPRLLHN